MKRVLMVAFHFPPFESSSGVQRTLRFVQYLPRYGWQPIVLTAHPRAYERKGADLFASIPEGTLVERAAVLDTARHLSIAGRYPRFLSRPDRWMTWRFGAVPAGLRLIRELQPQAIWSTYPIATAHAIGADLHRRSSLPWIADFRDPMCQDGYPADPGTWQSFKTIEETALQLARFSVFCTPGAARVYGERYPSEASRRISVVENGFDEEAFVAAESRALTAGPLVPGAVTLLHSGMVYASERDPTQFFEALGQLKRRSCLSADRVRIRFRASSQDELLRMLATRFNVADLVELLPPIPYGNALEEMIRAEALLVLQAANCNEQIPAKLYEYLRAGRPVIGLTDPLGDTAATLRKAGITSIAPLDSVEQIGSLLIQVFDAIAHGTAIAPNAAAVQASTRSARSRELAELLDAATAESCSH